jgi:eukaryotic-like serine/threonine-protein kinase
MTSRPQPDGDKRPLSSCRECGAIYRTPYARCPLDGGVIEPLDGDPLVGSTVAERYVIEDCIGEGAMGRVYRARHVRLSRRFAVKVLFGDLAADPTMRVRFAREAEVASRLDHPNVVAVLDFGETPEGLLYLAMDLVEGQNLGQLIEHGGAMPEQRVIALAREMCQGLEHAHELELVHRDFKPDNVVVVEKDDREVPRILDFGLAILSDTSSGTDGRLTTAGIVMGTPAYISPEQATGREVDHRADLFSLGVTLYEMLAGALPFEGTAVELARMNVSAAPPPIGTRNPEARVSTRMEKLVCRLMAKRPEDRYESAARVIEALDDLAAGVRRVERVRTAPTVYGAGSASASAEWEQTLPGQELSAELMSQLRPSGRRTLIIALSLVLAAATAALVILRLRGAPTDTEPAATAMAGPADTVAIEPPDPAPANAVAPVEDRPDAGGETAISVDTGGETAAVVDAAAAPAKATAQTPRPRKRASTSTRKPQPERPTRDQAAPPEPEVISAETVSALYTRVGGALQALEKSTDDATARPFKDRYFSIPISDAIRSPALRAEIVARLKKLERDLARARR